MVVDSYQRVSSGNLVDRMVVNIYRNTHTTDEKIRYLNHHENTRRKRAHDAQPWYMYTFQDFADEWHCVDYIYPSHRCDRVAQEAG